VTDRYGETVGSRIAALRGSMPLDELAEKIGVTRQAIAKWERDETHPRMVQLKALADALNVTPVYIAFGQEDPDARDVVTKAIIDKVGMLEEQEREHILTSINLLLANRRHENGGNKNGHNGTA